LLLAIVGGVTVISAVGMTLDYSREYRLGLEQILTSLEEQAGALQEAHRLLSDTQEFLHYVHRFCATMDRRISPGHSILVLDPGGAVLVRSQPYGGHDLLERTMLNARDMRTLVTRGGHRIAGVRLVSPEGYTFILAQYLDHEEAALHMQLIRRLLFLLLVALALILFVYLAVNRWVVAPLERLVDSARRWTLRDFSVRATAAGPQDIGLVAREFNVMAEQLELHEQHRLHELDRARRIQANLLPKGEPQVAGLKIAAEYRPAEHVAGDLYDFFALPDGRTAMAVLDVSGHGVGSAMLTGVLKVALHWRLTEHRDLAETMQWVNRDLLACTSDDHFATACVGIWEPDRGRWTYCAAGHPGGVLLRGETVVELPSTGFLLGALPRGEWTAQPIDLSPGDRVLLYTDGITETEVTRRPFGYDGLVAVLRRTAHQSLGEQTRAVMQAVVGANDGNLHDDMTVLALQFDPEPVGAGLTRRLSSQGIA
jgi:serine phosphatase RsbU (regulator of sigma subunit)